MLDDRKTSRLPNETYLETALRLLEKSQIEEFPYLETVAGREFVVHENVFSPRHFSGTEIFARNLPIRAGGSLLEIGPATGAIGITALHRGFGNLVAIDINDACIGCTKENADRHGVADRVEALHGDLFDVLRNGETFDTIFWNSPFCVTDIEVPTPLMRSVSDPLYTATRRYLSEGLRHLNPDGALLLGFSSVIGDFPRLQKVCGEVERQLELIYEENAVEVHPVKFEIFAVKAA